LLRRAGRRSSHAQPLGFTNCLEGRCLQRLRPIGRTDSTPIDDNPAKELQAAPLQVPAGCAVAATTERSPPVPARAWQFHLPDEHGALSYVPGVGDGAGAVSVAAGDGVATGELSGLGEGEGLSFAVLRFVLA
jgi:hypothetical protein